MRGKGRVWIVCLLFCGFLMVQGMYTDIRAQDVSGEREDVGEEYDLSRKEIRHSVTDAVYEKEIREKADPAYTSVDQLKLVNAVLVKQSLFDGSLVQDEDTIDSIMGAIENGDETEGDKFLTQISSVVALYELSKESDYYVACVNTMSPDQNARVKDYIFARYDNEGYVLDDCIYDMDTGLAYIPKKDCINEDGEQVIMNVQVQLMQVINFTDTSSEVLTSVREGGASVSVYETSAEIFDVETSVMTEKGLKEENMTVAVNGIPIQEEYYAYNPETGELALNQSPAMIQSVSVTTEKNSLIEQVADFLFQVNKVYALTADQMTAVAADIELPNWVSTGTLLTGSANYSYNDQSEWTYSYGFGINDEALLKQMIDLIEYGGNLDMSKVKTQYGSKYINTFVNLNENTLTNEGRSVPGIKNIPVLHMECCHANTALGSTSGSAVNGGNWSLQPIRLRFLNVDRSNGYAILGIYTIETHTQTGCAFFKVNLKEPYGYGNIGKKDAQTQAVLAGAVYQVYKDAACTQKAVDVYGNNAVFTTVVENPFSNTITFTPGTYYVKETKSPAGYMVDPVVKKLVIYAGERTWANVAGNKTGWNYDNQQIQLMLQKASGDEGLTKSNPCYDLGGAIYGVYQSKADALADKNRTATLETMDSGSSNKVFLDAGTYYVKELMPSSGFGICTGKHDLADEQGIHTVDAVQYGQTYSITCVEPVLSSKVSFELKKWDLETGKQEAQGDASLAGAVFRIRYYGNTEGSCKKTPIKTWYYKTDESGVVRSNDISCLISEVPVWSGTLRGDTDLYISSQDNWICLPLGTYMISEIQAPEHYQMVGRIGLENQTSNYSGLSEGKVLVVKEYQNQAVVYDGDQIVAGAYSAEQLAVNIYDEIYKGSLEVTKKDTKGNLLPGISFRLKGMTSGEEEVAVTDQYGVVLWENLVPQEYQITEIKTAQGLNLLKEPVKVVIPMEVKDEDVILNPDLMDAVWEPALQSHFMYDLSFEVTDDIKLQMPETGGNGNGQIVFFIIGTVVAAIGVYALRKSRKNTF